jgi:hypothetical protein
MYVYIYIYIVYMYIHICSRMLKLYLTDGIQKVYLSMFIYMYIFNHIYNCIYTIKCVKSKPIYLFRYVQMWIHRHMFIYNLVSQTEFRRYISSSRLGLELWCNSTILYQSSHPTPPLIYPYPYLHPYLYPYPCFTDGI